MWIEMRTLPLSSAIKRRARRLLPRFGLDIYAYSMHMDIEWDAAGYYA